MVTLDEAGVRYLTAASVSAFRTNGALWVMRYLFGRSDFRSAAFARSLALNNGLKMALHLGDGRAGEDIALFSFLRMLDEWGIDPKSPGARSEQDNILPMLDLTVNTLQRKFGGLKRPISTGLATHTFIGDISTPFLSVPSFIFDDVQLHLKYTNRCPSSPRPKDMMAMAIDMWLRPNLPSRVLYVTAKKVNWCEPTLPELTAAIEHLLEDAWAIEAFLAAAETREHALAMVPLNPDAYQWTMQLLGEARTILLNSKENVRGIVCAKGGRRLPEGPSGNPYWDLLPGDRPGDPDDEY